MNRSKRYYSLLKLSLKLVLTALFLLGMFSGLSAKPDWHQQEREHFTIVYREAHAYLVPHILQSAERALGRLSEIFEHEPSQKIVLATFDLSDYGTAGAMSVPRNMIRLEIEPFELGYEYMPYHDRIQWLMNHELVHIMVNDQASTAGSLSRSLFSRVPPEQEQPLSVGFSLLTNHTRYTPRWHQEGIASFMETWLSGGHGRVLASFDEMYFRTLVLESRAFPTPAELETKMSANSFLLGMLHYLYGTRFVAYLAVTCGVEKLLDWYRPQSGGFYQGMETRFKKVFSVDMHTAWEDFIRAEQQFQQENLARLNSAPLTPVKRLHEAPLGWVSQPYLDVAENTIIFGHHQSHHLTALNALNLSDLKIENIGTLPSPSIIQIASTAFDPTTRLFFYTTNNNQLFRDIHVMNLESGKSKLLFENVRVGQLTISPETHELWGIRHSQGRATLVYSAPPYQSLVPVMEFHMGDALQHLAVSPSGRYLAATLHQASGRQAVIVADIETLKKEGRFVYHTVSEDGSPEFPSWSPNEQYLYWNAYTNGVSNIYRSQRGSTKIEAMSHTLSGLFRPLYVSEDTLFVFEFSSKGFIPALIPNQPAKRLPAIEYCGQKVVERNPQIIGWNVETTPTRDTPFAENEIDAATSYRGLSNVKLHSLIPVISGFQEQKVVGLYTHLADPFFYHDIALEAGISNFQNDPAKPRFHFRGRYEYQRKYRIEVEHNASSFYDLFNERKAGLVGSKLLLGHTRFLKFDNPHKIKRTTEVSFYHGLKSINDNLITVNSPDFAVFETSLNSRNVRRAIGSVDSEFGSEWTITLSALGTSFQKPQFSGGMHGEWGLFRTWLRPHNIFHLKFAAGYLYNKDELAQGKFYFGGFGNQYVENKPVKQYRDTFHFPGIPVYSLAANHFAKIMIENNLPPLRLSKIGLGSHFLSHIDASLFTQGLLINPIRENVWANLGGQINFVFSHWFNLESTISAGAAQAWNLRGAGSREWFVSLKLLRN